ncbi:MAG TPA: hypothetical protein VNU97_07145 [Rhizomicrobium sp.]|nr:hypothetical protein [Rhizomicrobium sp.]
MGSLDYNSTTVVSHFREVVFGGWDTGAMHGFIVVRNNLTGKQWVSQGGPSYDVPCAYCLLPLPSDQSWTEPYTSSNTGYSQFYVSVSSFTTDLSSDAIVGQLSQFSNEFNSEELPYLYPTPNSNFYAGEAWQNLTGCSGIAIKRERTRMAGATMKRDENKSSNRRRNVRSLLFSLVGIAALALVIVLVQQGLARTGAHFFPPPMADGIKCDNWRNCSQANAAFTEVLRRRFPLGTPENVLRSTLLAQGFRTLPVSITACLPRGQEAPIGKLVIECPAWDFNWNPRDYLAYGWGGPPCGTDLSVKWSADKSGKITHLEGYYDYTCL